MVAVVPLALAFCNNNFIYVALMADFFVIPLLLGFAYFYYALSEECVASIRRGKVLFSVDGIERCFVDDDDCVVSQKKMVWTEFEMCVVDENGIMLFLKASGIKFEFIPKSAFADNEIDDVLGLIPKELLKKMNLRGIKISKKFAE